MFGPKWPFLLILIVYGPGVVFVKYWDRLPCGWDRFCTLGRAPHTKETLPDFREWCRVNRHPRVFRRLTGCQWDPREWGVTTCYQSQGKRLPWELGGCRVRYTIYQGLDGHGLEYCMHCVLCVNCVHNMSCCV